MSMKMKTSMVTTMMITMIMAMITASSHAEEPYIDVHSFQDASCGAWVGSAQKAWARAQYIYWFRGFVSGYNYASPHNQVDFDAMPDAKTLELFIDKYCRENPLKRFDSAAFELVEELTERRVGKS